MAASHRNTIFVEQAVLLSQQAFDGDQYVMRLAAPKTANAARPGSFVHLVCDPLLPMRRPFSIMRSGGADGWIEILYRIFGHGTALLARRRPGERLDLLGPIGKPFTPHPERPRPLLLGGGVGIPPIVFLAEQLKDRAAQYRPVAMIGSEVPFPFDPVQARTALPGAPDSAAMAMPLLDEWGIPNRLTSRQGYAGCFDGTITDLARLWLDGLTETQRAEIEIFACGPHPMLAATAAVAKQYRLPCQVSLEEFMACAVGGCAGCTVEVRTEQGPAMKRVCVDGPVFDAARVFP